MRHIQIGKALLRKNDEIVPSGAERRLIKAYGSDHKTIILETDEASYFVLVIRTSGETLYELSFGNKHNAAKKYDYLVLELSRAVALAESQIARLLPQH